MTILMAVLISIVVSLGISIYFHNLNKNEDPIGKVKKYADSRQEALLKLFNELKNDYNLIAADFKSEQTRANAAIKLLRQQNDDFADKINHLGENIEAVQKIKNQITYLRLLLQC